MFEFARLSAKTWISIGAALLALAVCSGAFGAHVLRDKLGDYSTSVYEKAVFYHFIHALGLLAVALAAKSGALEEGRAGAVCLALAFGVMIFSGSLYALAITDVKILGAITPIGGVLMIVAWVLLALP